MKKVSITLLFALLSFVAHAQESSTAYNFLRLPVSAHAAALGGDNISITDDDASMIFHNPALISNTSDKSININFMTYMEGVNIGSASFVKGWGERATWGASAMYMDYGKLKETTVTNEVVGNFSAKDVMLGGTFTYLLTNKIAGGITAKIISSTIGGYSSMAVGIDLGLNYYDAEREWSVSAVAKNLGGQVKAYDDNFEKIPFDLQIGTSKRLAAAPLRFSATLSRLNSWDDDFINHLAIGADLLLSSSIYVAAGYNFRRADEMKINQDDDSSSNHGAGLSLGGGIQLERFKLQMSYGKYHVSSTSLLFNLTYTL